MCGIGFLLGACPADQSELRTYISALRRRGPDADKQTAIELQGGRTLRLIAAVLHLRGEQMCSQPAEDAHGNILLWNGEVFDGLDVGPSESDTAKVLEMLSRTCSHREVVAALGRISGPFSLVYWCPGRRALYYGRDPAGRRSLVVRRPRTPEDSMAVLSCLPESAGPGGASSAKQASPPPAHYHHRHHHHQPTSEDEDTRDRLQRAPRPELATSSSCPAPQPHPDWEEVRADGIYVLNVDDSGTAEERAGGGGGGGGGNGDGWTAAAAPLCAELYPWSSLRGTGDGEGPLRVPVAGDTSRTVERRRRRRQARCAGDSAATDSCDAGENGEVGGEGGGDGRGKQQAGARDVIESRRNGRGDGDNRREGEELATPTPTPEATRVFGNSERVKPDGLECAGHIRPAAAGLLAKLRDSIHRRVSTVPHPTTPRASSPGDGTHGRRRRKESGDGAARGTKIDLQDDHEEAAQPGAGDGGGVRAAAVGRPGGGDTGFKDTAVAAAAAAESCACSRGGNAHAPEAKATAPRAAPVARVGVLFSGGLDSVVLAAMLAEEGGGRPAVPKGEAIDLINVCFDSPSGHQSPDRLASIAAVDELKSLFPSHVWRLICVDASYDDVLSQTGAVWRVMQPCTTTMDFNIAAAFWFASRGTGWLYQPPPGPPPPPPALSLGRVDADTTGLRPPHHRSTAPGGPRESGLAGGLSTVPPFSHQTSPATMAAAVGAPAGSGGDPAAGAPRGEGDTSQVSSDTAAGRRILASARNGRARTGTSNSSSSSSSSKGKKATKVNKNSAELCPVDGCRRLLKPGCVFDMCSRCCLRAQVLVDAAASSSSCAAVPPETRAEREKGAAAAAVVRERVAVTVVSETTADPTADTGAHEEGGAVAAVSAASERQRACKVRAEAEAARALEARLLDRFEAELSPPFRAKALAALLLLGHDGHTDSVVSRQADAIKSGRDRDRGRSSGPPLAASSCGARPQPIKWCAIHKRPRRKEEPDGSGVGGGATPAEGGGGRLEAGEERARRRRLAASAAVLSSAARVLLVGIGADEYMGGYSRHRNAFNRGGDDALAEELVKDQARLWTRNLGRDDRSIADHGREARFPFLDEDVVGYIRSLPLRDVCDMDEPAGFGDKKILREVASHLGLDGCRSLPKRAIQFGSRIAQHCARHTHGSHRRGSGSDPASAVGVGVGVP